MRVPILSLLLALSLHASAGDIDQPTALQMLQRADTVLIDVRTADEFAEGALPGAVRIETPDIAERIGTLAPEKDTPVVLYCRSGRRASEAQDVLEKLGYTQVINAGGYDELATVLPSD
ncbi:rhodanese-like domain-containing protein [Stutzerimonas kunmingensis]|jgi:phage shock protein E|uniref:rhodanese-like domain-containing protein n=1 Tax=Stutzerimonas stutzeri subgroup TaxID=578833 RepID=UPI0008578E6E|nr:rhodanese-like domain-containing protein [Stutzerimonas chloritidismutans]MBU0563027.1 rhodanese-like domain-containing protein [Gammaproteobacteria bacterium]OCX98448.1 MAG: sulfurtransferase [Pseudomonas sp. K35]TVT73953.1 MAG: rhodanese-like domain-containing protein [Pseudomonas sp.]MBU0837242.1 rhodanese-like domain-containing protein [Gammaproteobacteria bacterium]MBU1807588.1 rhodanese-like domain-containing protein [Gammaproteobacteria bacterium]